MTDARIAITVDGRDVTVAPGTTVAAALIQLDVTAFRVSVRGEPRGPICGMGICFECRVTIDGRAHQRACLRTCEAGMAITTAGGAHG